MADRAAELAYLEAQRALGAQQSTVDSAHARVGQVFTVAGIGTGFIGPAALDRHEGMPWLGWAALVLLVVTVVASVVIWWPRNWIWTNDAQLLASDDWAGRSEDDVYRHLARFMAGHITRNEPPIKQLLLTLQVAMIAASLSVIAWVLLIGTE
jgi:hypothetical protein